MKIKSNRELLLNGNIGKAILALAVPVVINSFLQTMYNLTDTYWLGRLGTEELAAINLVTPVQNIIINFGSRNLWERSGTGMQEAWRIRFFPVLCFFQSYVQYFVR